MPGRSVQVFESAEHDVRINTYYCLRCGNTVLMTESGLAGYPRRNTDGAYVVREDDVKSSNVVKGAMRDILRPNKGAEKQYRINCSECGVPVGYKVLDIDDLKNEVTYVFPGILSCNPTITLQSLQAEELAVPDCIRDAVADGKDVVTVDVVVSFGAHTKVQVVDVTRKGVLLQLKERFRSNAVQVNEALMHFFTRMLDAKKGGVQVAPGGNAQTVQVAIGKVSCGFVYASLLRVMMDVKYILPHTYDVDEEVAPTRKRKREGGEDGA
eukprot:TRINITY_DN3137_c0_g1_i1.p2 TRINITY_DN3137_c0_g1~~TRINITY_DN3137_c0_g1_i1.p2  ORF type:complete len:268 (+),score=93.72 TRINITY_DN3137_c0_g1_i1:107-910(+)